MKTLTEGEQRFYVSVSNVRFGESKTLSGTDIYDEVKNVMRAHNANRIIILYVKSTQGRPEVRILRAYVPSRHGPNPEDKARIYHPSFQLRMPFVVSAGYNPHIARMANVLGISDMELVSYIVRTIDRAFATPLSHASVIG